MYSEQIRLFRREHCRIFELWAQQTIFLSAVRRFADT
jgi:hypothetical protein